MTDRKLSETAKHELRAAVDAAVWALALEAAFLYGLIEPDPKVDVDRCNQILATAQENGVPIPSIKELVP